MMATYLRPGVYVEEIPSDGGLGLVGLPVGAPAGAADPNRARAGRNWMAEHSVAAFVGIASDGPLNTPVMIRNWTEFQRTFGDGFDDALFLGLAVQGFFANGGRTCQVVRVGERGAGGWSVDDIVGDVASRTGLSGLEALDDVSTVCIPDLMGLYAQGVVDLEAVRATQLALIAHCERMGDRIAVLDPPPNLSVQQVREWRVDITGFDTKYAAMYYPWLLVHSLSGSRAVPPCGAVAGMYARSDLQLGPHRSPANQTLSGVLGTDGEPTLSEQEYLNPIGVNALVTSAGRGVVVWGARTLSSEPDWRYLRKRRLMNFLGRNIRHVLEWVVFDDRPFEQLSDWLVGDLDELFALLWRSGVLDGDLPDESYQVRCDEEDNPTEGLDANQIVATCRAIVAGAGPITVRVVCFRG
jgi:hypothetical protein